jgi:lipopolysaccharide export system permease protein
MRLHDRYFLRELMTPLFFLLGAFMILSVGVFFTKELEGIQDRRLTVGEAAGYCAASLPEFFVVVLPILLLLALLYALTRHARYNEITALRAAGVSLWRVCLPYFAVGLAATAAYFATNEFAVPVCDRWAAEILSRHTRKEDAVKTPPKNMPSVTNARDRRTWLFSAADLAHDRLTNASVSWTASDESWRVVQADLAVYTNRVWTFYGVRQWVWQKGGTNLPESGVGTNTVRAVPELTETPKKLGTLLKYADMRALRASGYADIPLGELWDLMRDQPDLTREDANAVQTKFFGRLATPWECFVVVLVAIPFGAPAGRRNLFVGVAGSIFIGFAYFIVQRFSLAFGMAGHLPGWLAAWLPNLIFAATGIVLTMRVR